jgi:drug/metabolite transporter (DMT)-like permease
MKDKTKGVILMLISALFFALMASAVKWTEDLPLMQKIFFRDTIGFIVSVILIKKSRIPFKGNNVPFLILRSLIGFSAIVLYFYAISKLYLADASILENTNPFFIILFSFIFLKENIKKYQIATLVIGFLGALLVIKPQFNYTIVPSIMGLASGVFAGAAYTIVRYLSKTDYPQTIIFYFTATSLLITLPFLFMGHFIAPTLIQWIGLICIALSAATAQFLITNAYRYAPASELSIYNYTQILFALFLGMLFWSEIPDLLSLTGGVLIVLSGYINYRYSRDKQPIEQTLESR